MTEEEKDIRHYEMKKELDKPLDPNSVSSRKAGFSQVSYLETWTVINTANRIFDYNWSFIIDDVKEVWSGKIKDRIEVSYVCHGHVVIGDTIHHDVGYGNGMDKGGNQGACHELASKEAVSDCMKRCLRSYGNQFGNSLYDKQKEWQNSEPEPVAQTEKVKFVTSIQALLGSKCPTTGEEWTVYIKDLCDKLEIKVAAISSIEAESTMWGNLGDEAVKQHMDVNSNE